MVTALLTGNLGYVRRVSVILRSYSLEINN